MENENMKQMYLLDKALDLTSKSFGYTNEYMNDIVPILKSLVLTGDMRAFEAFAKIKAAILVELVHLEKIEQTLRECEES